MIERNTPDLSYLIPPDQRSRIDRVPVAEVAANLRGAPPDAFRDSAGIRWVRDGDDYVRAN